MALLRISERLDDGDTPAAATLTLPFELRQKSRLRARLDDGTEVGLFLTRGTLLRGGDRLRAENGLVVAVRAAEEPVSTAHCADARLLARACYHLGNRHVALEVGEGWLRYQHDHVLDEMVRALGLTPVAERAPFEPEGGAYAAGHAHGHEHGHGHDDHDHHLHDDHHHHTHAHEHGE